MVLIHRLAYDESSVSISCCISVIISGANMPLKNLWLGQCAVQVVAVAAAVAVVVLMS